MQAGRELDALVAEKVMGKSLKRKVWSDGSVTTAAKWKSLVPRYSTSIEAAWQVVEKMRERQRIAQENNTSDQVWVKFVWALPMAQHGVHYMLLNLTPEAICLAALKASGVEVA